MNTQNTFVIYYQFKKEGRPSSLKREVIKAENEKQAKELFEVMLQSRLESKETLEIVEIYHLIRF